MNPPAQRAPHHPREILREFWNELPVFYFYVAAIGLHHFVLANVPEEMFLHSGVSQSGVALTTVIPMSVVAAYYLLRAKRSEQIRNFPLAASVVLLLTFGVPVLIYLAYAFSPESKYVLDSRGIILWFEVTQIIWYVLFFIHTLAKRGWAGIVLFWGVALFYGVFLENIGIFAEFFYEDNFRLYLPYLPAPICTMFGWVMVMYVCFYIAEGFREMLPRLNWTPLKTAFLTTAVALALDSQLDPLASLSGIWWRWNEHLTGIWFGVPMINYVAWFSAVLPFAYGLHTITRRTEWTPMEQNKHLFYRLLPITLAAGALNFGIMALWEILTEGAFLTGPTFRIIDDFFIKVWPYVS